VIAVPRIRRPLRIAQHVIKALLPWLLPAHQIFERARYSASKLFHFEPNSRNSCSDAAREFIALSSDSIEDCAALSFSRSFPAPNLGSDGAKLSNVSRNSVRSLPKTLQSVLLIFDIELVGTVVEDALEREKHPAGCGCGCDRLKESLRS